MRQENFANPKLRELPVEVRERPLKNILIGVVLRTLIAPIILISFLLFVALRQSGIPIYNILFVPLLFFAAILITVRIYRLSARYFIKPAGKLQFDARVPILYLRSFYDDYKEILERHDKKTPEEILTTVLEMAGPVIAIGMPHESGLPLLGATRIYVEDKKWQEVVERLIPLSQLVVFHAGTSPGVDWELQAVRRILKQPQKLLITFLLWQNHNAGSSPSLLQVPDWAYSQFAIRFKKVFNHDLPPFNGKTSFIYFEADWTPRTIELSPEVAQLDINVPLIHRPEPAIQPKSIADAILNLLDQRGLLKPMDQAKRRINYLWLFFSMRGRINRETFWVRGLLPLAIFFFSAGYLLKATHLDTLGGWLIKFMAWPLLGLTVKRVHDFGIPGWAAALTLIPYHGQFIALISGLVKGNNGFNRFGPRGL